MARPYANDLRRKFLHLKLFRQLPQGPFALLIGNRKLFGARSPVLVHYGTRENLLRHMSRKPVSGLCDKRTLLGALCPVLDAEGIVDGVLQLLPVDVIIDSRASPIGTSHSTHRSRSDQLSARGDSHRRATWLCRQNSPDRQQKFPDSLPRQSAAHASQRQR